MTKISPIIPAIRRKVALIDAAAEAALREAAQKITDEIPEQIARAYCAKRDFAEIMPIRHGQEFHYPSLAYYCAPPVKPVPEWLEPTAKFVWDYCLDHGLQPQFSKTSIWNRSCNLIVHWDPAYLASLLELPKGEALVELLRYIETTCGQGQRDREKNAARIQEKEDEPIIAHVKLRGEMSRRITGLVDAADSDYEELRAHVLGELGRLGLAKPADSLTSALAKNFPNLPLRDRWETAGGPRLNRHFWWLLLRDLLGRLNEWSAACGCAEALYAKLDEAEDSRTLGTFEGVEAKVCYAGRLGRRALTLTRGEDQIELSLSKETETGERWFPHSTTCVHKFYGFTHSTNLSGAVEMVEAFMRGWPQQGN